MVLMARIALDISDPGLRITVEMMLRAEGHEITADTPEVTIADSPAGALNALAVSQSLLLTTASGISDAVTVMHQGIYGYILLPLQPGEAGLMAARAAANAGVRTVRSGDLEEPILSLAEVERMHIEKVLRAYKGNQVKAAHVLEIGRNTLWRKLKSWKKNTDDTL